MSEEERAPLLAASASQSNGSTSRQNDSGEITPLLSSRTETPRYDGEHDSADQEDATSIHSAKKKKPRRWPSIVAMIILGLLVVAIIVLAFVIPDAVQEYAKEAAVIEPTNLSLESITKDGVKARVQANFRLEGSRVGNDHVRRIGRAVTWIASSLGTQETTVTVNLPDYGSVLLGSAVIPPLSINLRDGQTTYFDFVTEMSTGDMEGIRTLANKFLDGQLDWLRVKGTADLSLKSGIIPLGTHTVSHLQVFEANKIPQMPKYNITRLTVKDVPAPGNAKSMVADVSLSAYNKYPVGLSVPELAFEILVPGCPGRGSFILVADAVTSKLSVVPESNVEVDVHGIVRPLPDSLTRDCPHTSSSPLDLLLKEYMHGRPATLYVRGSSNPDGSTPGWIADILSSVTVPVPFPGRSLNGLIRNFSLTETHITLPDPFAEPGDPKQDPMVSGKILVTAGVPGQMNFDINVTRVRAFADVFYQSRKFGELNLEKWQDANSTRIAARKGEDEATLKIQSIVKDVPLNVTDEDVFAHVLQSLIFGKKMALLDIKAKVDVQVETALGPVTLKEIPAHGRIPVKPISGGRGNPLEGLEPKVGSLRILETSPDSMTFSALVNVTNPTPYTAKVPYANIHVSSNGSTLGEVTVRNIDVGAGVNADILVTAKWNTSMGGDEGKRAGRDALSRYISGMNTSLTFMAHEGTIPGQPLLSRALSRLNITLNAPRLHLPGDTPDERSHFIRDATFHFFSSTATFTLVSPLQHNVVFVDRIDATALYNHTEEVGRILYELPFEAPPGMSTTPRLPVDWSTDSIGFDKVKKALGGQLKLDAVADVDLRIGQWTESVWFVGKGIGAKVHI